MMSFILTEMIFVGVPLGIIYRILMNSESASKRLIGKYFGKVLFWSPIWLPIVGELSRALLSPVFPKVASLIDISLLFLCLSAISIGAIPILFGSELGLSIIVRCLVTISYWIVMLTSSFFALFLIMHILELLGLR